jgi:hypothetical protein
MPATSVWQLLRQLGPVAALGAAAKPCGLLLLLALLLVVVPQGGLLFLVLLMA